MSARRIWTQRRDDSHSDLVTLLSYITLINTYPIA